MVDLFGKGGYFEEQKDPTCLSTYRDQFNPDVTFDVSGPLTMDYMYGATDHDNKFGYYYWQDGEDPAKATRYILIDNATPQNNITINDTALSGGMALSAIYLYGTNPEESTDVLKGTSYKVPYFKSDGTATYDFPSGTHIAFFLIVNGMDKKENSEEVNTDQWLTMTNLSVRSHNYNFGRTFSGYDRESDSSNTPDSTLGEIDAITFRYNGTYYLGFEDRGGDKDMNDIVFFLTGSVTPKYPVIEIGETPDTEEWLLACEDLGSTDDYDFNDIVFSIKHVAGETAALITPLAAGGTLKAVVMYDGNPINGTVDESEIHYLVNKTQNCESGSYPMLNTYNLTAGAITPGVGFGITVTSDFSIANNLSKFTIQVEGKDASYIVKAPTTGMAPQILCLPGTWCWPIERIHITQAYPSFENWNKDSEDITWYSDSYVQTDRLIRR